MIEVLKYLKPGAIVPIDIQTTKALVDALRQAIAELESQEPVAYINVEKRILEWAKLTSWETPTVVNLPKIPLYTHPPQRTEQEPLANELAQLKEEIALLKYKLWDYEEKSKPMQGH